MDSAPLYAGLIVAELLYAYKFLVELWEMMTHIHKMEETVFIRVRHPTGLDRQDHAKEQETLMEGRQSPLIIRQPSRVEGHTQPHISFLTRD